jgi:hypothetical protein
MARFNKTTDGLLYLDNFTEQSLMWTLSPSDANCIRFGEGGLTILHNRRYTTFTIVEPEAEEFSCIVELDHIPFNNKDIGGVIIISSNKDIKITEKNREIINKSIQTYNEIMKPYDLKDRRFILTNVSDFYKSFIRDIVDGIVETDVYYKIVGPFYIVEEELEPSENKIFDNGFSYCNEKKCFNSFDYKIYVEIDPLVELSVYFYNDSNKQLKIPVYYTYNNDKHVEYFFKVTKVKSKEITITISQKYI